MFITFFYAFISVIDIPFACECRPQHIMKICNGKENTHEKQAPTIVLKFDR